MFKLFNAMGLSSSKQPVFRKSLIACLIMIISTTAQANAGVPMIFLVWPIFGISLIPIIAIESWVLINRLKSTFHWRMVRVTTVSNLVTTIIGIPVTWLILVCIEFAISRGRPSYPSLPKFWEDVLGVTLHAPWLAPVEGSLHWMVPVAFMFMLIPFFIMSYWVEAAISVQMLKKYHKRTEVRKAVWDGNVASYGLLTALSTIFLIYEVITH
jgi:hypothetical protein